MYCNKVSTYKVFGMDKKLEDYIGRYGGKHGGLQYVRELKDGVGTPNFEILDAGQSLSSEVRRAVDAACKEAGTDKVIIRTSEPSDWDGMVDVMPTEIGNNSWLSLQWNLALVRRLAARDAVIKYAANEGFVYDPNRVTVSIAPYVCEVTKSSPRCTYTQHPNLEKRVQVDVTSPSTTGIGLQHEPRWFRTDNPARRAEAGDKFFNFIDKLHTGDFLDENEAYQFEGGIDKKGEPVLFQIRKFADKVNGVACCNTQFVGDATLDLQVPVCYVENRSDFARFERSNPGVQYMLSLWHARDPLSVSDQPSGMVGYSVNYSFPALAHQNTRLVKMALKRGGFVYLNDDLRGPVSQYDKLMHARVENGEFKLSRV